VYIGPESTGIFSSSSVGATQYVYNNLKSRSDAAKGAIVANRSPHVERFGFGDGNQTLVEYVEGAEKHFGPVGWKVQVIDGQLLRLEQYLKRSGEPTVRVFDLDPARGYTLKHMEARSFDGRLTRAFSVDTEDVTGRGDWFPLRVRYQYFGPETKSGDDPQFVEEISVRSVQINPIFEPSTFTLDSLKLPNGTRLRFVGADGVSQHRVKTTAGFVAAAPNVAAGRSLSVPVESNESGRSPTLLVIALAFALLGVLFIFIRGRRGPTASGR
jgi:hypothetical protein